MIISHVSTKGGVCKSTLAQTLAFSGAFARKFKSIGLVEFDPQGTLGDWFEQRGERARIGPVTFGQFLGDNPASEVKRLAAANGALVLDVPGESRSAFATRFAVAASDVVIIPCRSSTKDEAALAMNLWPFIQELARPDLKIMVIPVMVHPQSRPKTHADYFGGILPPQLDVCPLPLPARSVFENFDRDGNTLAEYAESVKSNQRAHAQAQRAIGDIEAIAKEIIKYAAT